MMYKYAPVLQSAGGKWRAARRSSVQLAKTDDDATTEQVSRTGEPKLRNGLANLRVERSYWLVFVTRRDLTIGNNNETSHSRNQ